MPDEGTNVVEKRESVEVLDLAGNTAKPSSLGGVFDAIAAAKDDGVSAKEAAANFNRSNAQQRPEPKEQKPEPKPVEKQEKKDTKLDEKLEEKKEVKEETDPRKALQNAFDKRQEQKDEVKAETKDKEEDVSDDELKPLPNDKPKTVKRIKALLGKIDAVSQEVAKTKAERDEKDKKLAELEKKLGEVQSVNPETNEAIKKQLDELAMLRRRYELDNDPDIKSKFDGRVTAAEESIVSTLKRRNASDALLNLIKDQGGWMKFAESAKLVTIPDGQDGVKQVTSAELADLILQQLPLGERKAVEAAMLEQVSTQREKDRYFKEEQAKADKFFKEREESGKKAQEEQQKQVKEAEKAINDWKAKVESSDWLKDKQVDEKASEAEKKAAQEHNRYNAQLKSFLTKAIQTKDLNGMLEIIEDSVRYYDERRTTASQKAEIDSLKAQLKAKEDELVKFKRGGGTLPKPGSIASPTKSDSTPAERQPQTLSGAFDAIQSGAKLRGGILVDDGD